MPVSRCQHDAADVVDELAMPKSTTFYRVAKRPGVLYRASRCRQ